MVDELRFEDNSSPWEAYTNDREAYVQWAEEKKSQGRFIHPFVSGTGLEFEEGEVVPVGGAKRARGKEVQP